VVHILQQYQFHHVVVDYSQVKIVGSIVLDAVAAFCRAARGGAVQCAADPEMLSILETMKFTTIWPYYPTRDEAVQAVRMRQKAAVT
jgi:anti-anti-sigma regulatory factor